jgi:hypothetical protein
VQAILTSHEALSRNRQHGEKLVVNTGHNCRLPGSCSQFINLQQDRSGALTSLSATKSGKRYIIEPFRGFIRRK